MSANDTISFSKYGKTFQEKLREDNDLATLRRIDEKYFKKSDNNY